MGAVAAVIAVVVLAWSTLLAQAVIFPRAADSDTVWLLLLADDVFGKGGRFAAWELSTHANVFPELLFVDLARRPSWDVQSFFLFHSLVIVAAFFLVAWLCLWLYLRARGTPGSRTSLATLSLLGAFVVSGAWMLAFNHGLLARLLGLAFMPAFHFPAFVMSLLIGFLAIDQLDRPLSFGSGAMTLLAALLLLMTGLSDKLAVIDVLPGFLVAAAYQTVRLRRLNAGLVLSAALLTAAGLTALLGADLFWSVFARVKPYPATIDLSRLGEQSAELVRALLEPRGRAFGRSVLAWIQPVVVLALVATTFVLLGRLLSRLCARDEEAQPPRGVSADSMLVFLLSSTLLIPAIALAFSRFRFEYDLRFIIPSIYFPALAVVATVLGGIDREPRPKTMLAAFAIAGALFIAVPIRTDAAPFRHYEDPPLLACLRAYSSRYPLRRGLGFHWDAQLTTAASGGEVAVQSIYKDGRLRLWANSLDFFTPRADRPFTFIAISQRLDRDALEKRFGAPTWVLQCPAEGTPERALEEMDAWPAGSTDAVLWVYDADGAARLSAEMESQWAQASTKVRDRPHRRPRRAR